MSSVTVFGWLREDGTISWDRDEIQSNVRRVIQKFKNSDAFIERVNAQWDEMWKDAGSRKR